MLTSAIVIFMLLCCSAFFSGSETAIFSLSQVRIHQLRESSRQAARMLSRALDHPRRTLITILLGNELSNVSLSIVCATLISRLFGISPLAETAISVIAVTPLVLLLGEIIPKNIALKFAPAYAQIAIVPLRMLYVITYPIQIVLTAIANAFIRLFGGNIEEQPFIVEREYRKLIDLGRREGVIIEEEREIIHSIFEFSDKVVNNIMTPAERVFALPVDIPYEELLSSLRERRHSRIPIYEGQENNVIGILHLRDLFAFDRRKRATGQGSLRDILIAPLFVSKEYKLEQLLKSFQKKRVHLAVVRDERGTVDGIVTMDDVLMDLFGDIEV